MLTPALLIAATGCRSVEAELYAQPLWDACARFSIITRERMAAFLGQLAHESGSLRFAAEIWGPTEAQQRYEGRQDLGNVHKGDGQRYKGRGLIQVTGRRNYQRARDGLRAELADMVPDFEVQPELLAEPTWACWSAAHWWARNGCNELADADDVIGIGRCVNRGNARSSAPANGEQDRIERTDRARIALRDWTGTSSMPAEPEIAATGPETASPGELTQITQEHTPMAPFLAAALPLLVDAIPKLSRLFGSGSAVSERNIKAAETVAEIVKSATGAANLQEAVERIKADPAKLAAATQAIEARWFDLAEAGGGGIEGAGKRDAEFSSGRADMLHSPSFWVAVLLLPLVYLLVLSLIGVVGSATWSDDVRAGLAGSLISAVIGGLVGYYYGQTTSRNRTPQS